jgi:hypothetical protein
MKASKQIPQYQESTNPSDIVSNRKQFVIKLAKKYLTYEDATAFEKFPMSKYVNDNKRVYHVRDMLLNKYRQEQSEWQKRNSELRKSRSKNKY